LSGGWGAGPLGERREGKEEYKERERGKKMVYEKLRGSRDVLSN